MTHLRLYMLGQFQALLDDRPLRGFASDKERALLAYLALAPQGRPLRRESLMEMFWEGFTTDTARHSLRNALYNLRKMLAPLGLLHATRQTVQLAVTHPDFWCDARLLEQVASDPSASLPQVQDALAHVHKDLLQGLDLRDCPAFVAWLAEQRLQLAAQVKRLEVKREYLSAALVASKSFLPRSLTPFFGRERELALLAEKIVAPTCGLITLVGDGGIGKTRLALALAEQVRTAFPSGVWFVSLATVSPDNELSDKSNQSFPIAERLATAIATRLSLPLRPGASAVDQLVQRLAGQRLLLLLDNFEHLPGAEPVLVDLLQAAPSLCLLVTSRRRLGLQAECVFRLEGLPVPPITIRAGQPSTALEDLQHYSSIQLFVERAERTQGGFALREPDWGAVARICQLTEGLPLGIELAAALTDQHSCTEIADAIAATVDTLASSMADLAPRHRSLRALFEYSWQLLTRHERASLARCSVFRGGFSPEAAAAVAGCSSQVLTSLVDKSRLRQDDATRYGMHELLRQLAVEKLMDEPDDPEATASKHCAYYAQFLHDRERDLADDPELMSEASQEYDNLMAAWQTAVRQRDFTALSQMARGLAQLWYSLGLFQQAGIRLAEAVAALRAELTCTADVTRAQAALARVLVEQSFYSLRQGQMSAATAQAEEAVQLGQMLADDYLEADGSLHLAAILWASNRPQAAEEATRRGLEKAEKIGDADLSAIGLAGLSILARKRGQIDVSLDLDEQALQRVQTTGKLRTMGQVLSNLGAGYSESGDFRKAMDRLKRALELRRQTSDRLGIGIVLLHLGRVSLMVGDVIAAQQHLDEALAVFEIMESIRYRSEALAHRALAHLGRQAYNAAHQDARQACDLAVAATTGSAQALAHLASARVWWTQGEFQPALEAYDAALAIATEQADNEAHLPALTGKARVLAAQGDWPAARAVVQQMLPLPENIIFRPLLGTIDSHLIAGQALATVDPVQAQAILRHVHRCLLAAADTIDDHASRHTFLHDIASHRQILAQVAALQAG